MIESESRRTILTAVFITVGIIGLAMFLVLLVTIRLYIINDQTDRQNRLLAPQIPHFVQRLLCIPRRIRRSPDTIDTWVRQHDPGEHVPNIEFLFTQDELDKRLKTIILSSDDLRGSGSADKKAKEFRYAIIECPVCLVDFRAGNNVRILGCNHMYHVRCIDYWLTTYSSCCPVCKVDCKASSNSVSLQPNADFIVALGNNPRSTNMLVCEEVRHPESVVIR